MPAQKKKIFKICPQCKGLKEVFDPSWTPSTPSGSPEHPLVECPTCLGEGQIEWGYMLEPNP